ncbi:hypothetical protein MLD52_23430, partial [Puniceicoccaceae bacterium K14]|nr:hypothetical protein [Puniceicoccaceae bacterium K14]
ARSNGLSGSNYEQYRIGGGNVGYDEAFVMPFKLPAKGASEAVLAGEFSANIISFGPSLVGQINVYGLAYRSSPNVLQSDFYQGAFVEDMSSVWALQEGFVASSGVSGVHTTSSDFSS